MSLFSRRLLMTCALIMAATAFSSIPAEARTHHKHHHSHRHHVATRHHVKKKLKTQAHTNVRTAQRHLINLLYLNGKADGKMGPKTAAAIRKFQRDQHLPVNGKLTVATYNALIEADAPVTTTMIESNAPPPVPATDFYAKHPDFYGHYDQQYADPMITAPGIVNQEGTAITRSQTLPTRYGKIETSEDKNGSQKRYDVTLNGQSVLTVDNQPSVIGISKTYELGDEDAIVFTTYHDASTTCPYKHYLMTLKQDGNNLQEIDNCTRGYQAHVNEGSLFIEFLEPDDARAIGNTWRYENGRLERL